VQPADCPFTVAGCSLKVDKSPFCDHTFCIYNSYP
jgi:hypothetical protein